MENIFKVADFDGASAGTTMRGVCYARNISRKLTKAEKPYYTFNLSTVEGTVSAKTFNAATFEPLYEANTLSDCVVEFEGSVDEFNGAKEMKVENIIVLEKGEYDIKDFLKKYYEVETLKAEMKDLINAEITPTGVELIKEFFKEPGLAERFEEEFAATSHHDNCLNGLFAHTLKVMKWTKNIIEMYQGLLDYEEDSLTPAQRKDLLMIGSLIHDIDKVNEMNYGEYQPTSILNHRVRGIIRIAELKDVIIDKYNEAFYNHLIMLVDGHHGMYGDPIETLFAYIVNMADNLDAKLTVVEKDLKENICNNVSGKTIKIGIPKTETFANVCVKI